MDKQAEQALQQAVLRYNTKTTTPFSTPEEFTVTGFQSKLTATPHDGKFKYAITNTFGRPFLECVGESEDFGDMLQAFHSFSGVTQQLMNADGSAPFEVALFRKWVNEVSK